jgi:hypothetical protein
MACRPMPPSEQPRVFISYARKDGAALAERLQRDLKEQGFDAWLDTRASSAEPPRPPTSSALSSTTWRS